MSKFNRGNSKASKLSPSDVLSLRQRYEAGATQGALARDFHISVGQVGRIVRGEAWNSYENPAAEPSGPLLSVEESQRKLLAMLAEKSLAVVAEGDPSREVEAESSPVLAKLLDECNESPRGAERLLDELEGKK